METYILMFYLWTASVHAGGTVTMQEFSSREKCQEAAQVAKDTFAGIASQAYFACVPK